MMFVQPRRCMAHFRVENCASSTWAARNVLRAAGPFRRWPSRIQDLSPVAWYADRGTAQTPEVQLSKIVGRDRCNSQVGRRSNASPRSLRTPLGGSPTETARFMGDEACGWGGVSVRRIKPRATTQACDCFGTKPPDIKGHAMNEGEQHAILQ